MSVGHPVGAAGFFALQLEETGPDAQILFGEAKIPEGFPAILRATGEYQADTAKGYYSKKLDLRYHFILQFFLVRFGQVHGAGEQPPYFLVRRQAASRAFQSSSSPIPFELVTSAVGGGVFTEHAEDQHLVYALEEDFLFNPGEVVDIEVTVDTSTSFEIYFCGRYINKQLQLANNLSR